MPFRESRNTNTGGIYSEVHSPITTPQIIWVNITTNQRLSPTFQGNGNTIFVGDSQTFALPIFPEGGGTSVHRLLDVLRSLS